MLGASHFLTPSSCWFPPQFWNLYYPHIMLLTTSFLTATIPFVVSQGIVLPSIATTAEEIVWVSWSTEISSYPTATFEALGGTTHRPIVFLALIASLGVVQTAIFSIIWYRQGRRSKTANGNAQKWKERTNRKWLEKTMDDGFNSGSRDLEANPLATLFSSSTALPSSNGVLPSSKERRERQWEFRQSMSTASMTDTLRPISTIPSSSIWPERSDDGLHMEGPYLTQSMRHESIITSIPSTEDSRIYHALTSAELAQILRSPQPSSSLHTSGTLQNSPTEPSPFFRAWAKEAEDNGYDGNERES